MSTTARQTSRQSALFQWALHELGTRVSAQAVLTDVAGDASSRRYLRLSDPQGSYILMDAPPETEKNAAFLQRRALLQDLSVRVPQVLAVDMERGFLLLEDFGDRMLLPALDEDSAEGHYATAFNILLRLSANAEAEGETPVYDEPLLAEELSRFGQWFAQSLLGANLASDELQILGRANDFLIESALSQPRVLVHRDFHSRNLMLLEGGELGVIDFQDAVIGPYTYDLVSLLRDCYIRWPSAQVRAWALHYRELLVQADSLVVASPDEFLRQFDLMGLQRHIKVLGTFARLYLRDGKSAYLADLPLVLEYTREVLAGYAAHEPALKEFLAWFTDELEPRIAQQPWSSKH